MTLYPPYRISPLAFLLLLCYFGHAQYTVQYSIIDSSGALVGRPVLQQQFQQRLLAEKYIQSIPHSLQRQGYLGASVDSVALLEQTAFVQVYFGTQWHWDTIRVKPQDMAFLEAIRWLPEQWQGAVCNWPEWEERRQDLLHQLENNGYPYASIAMQVEMQSSGRVGGHLVIDRGPLYKIDSLRNHGSAKISNTFLQRYLNISNGSVYKKDALQLISKRINELNFLKEHQPWTLIRLGTGAVVDLDLEPRKNNQVNVLLGFLPATNTSINPYEAARTRMQFTGEAQIDLNNALSYGETIHVNWQQLQVKAPRLNLQYRQSYIAGSTLGTHLQFDLFKKDSSFLTIHMKAGLDLTHSPELRGSFFVQSRKSQLIALDTLRIRATHALPNELDWSVWSMGAEYEGTHTNFKYNPTKGSQWQVRVMAGTRKIKVQQAIIQLKDPFDPSFRFQSLYDSLEKRSYQFRIEGQFAHYIPMLKRATLKLATHIAWVESPRLYRNELYQIGGYRLLRGFDEESIYAAQYSVCTAEYRYLLGRNSYLFAFTDGAWVRPMPTMRIVSFWGAGLGMALETKGGLFNMSFAAGKQHGQALNLRQSKLHFGYLSYF